MRASTGGAARGSGDGGMSGIRVNSGLSGSSRGGGIVPLSSSSNERSMSRGRSELRWSDGRPPRVGDSSQADQLPPPGTSMSGEQGDAHEKVAALSTDEKQSKGSSNCCGSIFDIFGACCGKRNQSDSPKQGGGIAEFKCTLQSDAAWLQGVISIAGCHICFESKQNNVSKLFPLEQIKEVCKSAKSGFETALEVITWEEKMILASFTSRDTTYESIMSQLRLFHVSVNSSRFCKHLDKPRSGSAGAGQKKTSSGSIPKVERWLASADKGVTNSEINYGGHDSMAKSYDEACEYTANDIASSQPTTPNDASNGMTQGFTQLSEDRKRGKKKRVTSSWKSDERDGRANGTPKRDKHGKTVKTKGRTRSRVLRAMEQHRSPKVDRKFEPIFQGEMPVSVEEFFELFISDGSLEFLESVYSSQGAFDFQCTAWGRNSTNHVVRHVKCKRYVGGDLTCWHQKHCFQIHANHHLVLKVVQEVANIPQAERFRIKERWDVERAKKMRKTHCLLTISEDELSQSVKGRFSNDAMSMIKDVHKRWVDLARAKLAGSSSSNANATLVKSRSLPMNLGGSSRSNSSRLQHGAAVAGVASKIGRQHAEAPDLTSHYSLIYRGSVLSGRNRQVLHTEPVGDDEMRHASTDATLPSAGDEDNRLFRRVIHNELSNSQNDRDGGFANVGRTAEYITMASLPSVSSSINSPAISASTGLTASSSQHEVHVREASKTFASPSPSYSAGAAVRSSDWSRRTCSSLGLGFNMEEARQTQPHNANAAVISSTKVLDILLTDTENDDDEEEEEDDDDDDSYFNSNSDPDDESDLELDYVKISTSGLLR